MKRFLSVLASAVLVSSLLFCPALAETVTLSGTVVSTRTETVTASVGGTVGEVLVSSGDHVQIGDTLVTLETEKIYALQDGTVCLFGEVGDSVSMITDRYGAVAYIEPDALYTVSASTKNAYDTEENKIIHPGESVWLKGQSSKNTGTGIVTSVSGSSYNVELVSGSFDSGESVYVYRDAEYSATSRIGRGSVVRQDPQAYSGDGIVVSFPVEDGTRVSKGTVLFETLSGTYANQTGGLTSVTASRDGVIAEISLNRGGTLTSGETVASLYADEDLRIEVAVTEADLQYVHAGDTVTVVLTYLDDGEYAVGGVVEKIARTAASADEETGESSYAVLIRPDSTDRLYYGMNAVVELNP